MFQGVWTTGLTWSTRPSSSSHRHKTDFDFLREIGHGGFGRVFHVRHQLDGQEYALKIVRTSPSRKEMEKILREVQVLSSIQNEHVVRYYSAWIGPGDLAGELGQEDGSWTDDNYSSEYLSTNSHLETRTKRSHYSSDPICNLCQSSYKDWEVTLEQWGLIDAVLQPLDLCVECYKKSIPMNVDVSQISIRDSTMIPDCLYILMEYCESTLTEAVQDIRRRDGVGGGGDDALWGLFGQVLEGFAHLHANGIIHRDVKPSNLFVHNHKAKIGDLGLATTTIRHSSTESTSMTRSQGDSNSSTTSNTGISKSSDVGTFLYMAPEVSEGKYYDEKSDIYSLGIVLVEIFHPTFSTSMERVKVLGDLHRGIFPKEWKTTTSSHSSSFPLVQDIAQRMLQSEDPNKRPSCLDILQELQSKGLCQGHPVKDLVINLQSQVKSLQKIVNVQNQEIERLRQLLQDNNISFD